MLKSELAECCFTSTETVGLLGTGAQDGHLDSHTAPELCEVQFCITSTETVGLLETGAQDGHLDSHTASELCQVQCCITSTETVRIIRDGEPRTATSTFIHTAPEL